MVMVMFVLILCNKRTTTNVDNITGCDRYVHRTCWGVSGHSQFTMLTSFNNRFQCNNLSISLSKNINTGWWGKCNSRYICDFPRSGHLELQRSGRPGFPPLSLFSIICCSSFVWFLSYTSSFAFFSIKNSLTLWVGRGSLLVWLRGLFAPISVQGGRHCSPPVCHQCHQQSCKLCRLIQVSKFDIFDAQFNSFWHKIDFSEA